MKGTPTGIGKVSIVGAGPGDPDLLTIKAMKAIQSADVLVFDNLVSGEIRALFPSDAKAIYVGKAKGKHSHSQGEINQLIAQQALSGRNLCRVKGGDAYVFGRGAEEVHYLSHYGIQAEVIPGITAASGCTTYAGIPLTHRGVAQGCTFITAHTCNDEALPWPALAQLKQTLVIYMGLTKTKQISAELIANGLLGETPVAIIEKGCTPEQRNIIGKLHQLTELKNKYHVQSPALIVVGEVVSLQQDVTSPIVASLNSCKQNWKSLIEIQSHLPTHITE